MSSVTCPVVQHFSTLAHKGHDFRGGGLIKHKMCVFIFYTNFAGNISHSEKHWARCGKKMCIGLHIKYPLCLSYFNGTWIFSTCFRKYSNIKFYKNPSIGNRVVPCARADMTKLTVAFRKFANAPKNLEGSPHSLPSYVRITVVCADLSKISRHSS